MNILYAAGGTGGHLFPAISVAEKISELTDGKANHFFIGTEKRIESVKVPHLGYHYTATPIKPIPGKNFKILNWFVEFRKSISIAKKLIKTQNIDALICTGAYLSYPPALAAKSLKIPVYLMESNVNLGKANKMNSKFAKAIFTSWDKTKYYLGKTKSEIILSGNPVRDSIYSNLSQEQAKEKLNFDPLKPLVLVIGGSLGAQKINDNIKQNLDFFKDKNISLLWQTGGSFDSQSNLNKDNDIKQVHFIDDMGTAYKAADLVVSRSGATALAEITNLGKASILIPLGTAANNEQFHNATQVVEKHAVLMVIEGQIDLLPTKIEEYIFDTNKLETLSNNLKEFANPNSSEIIAKKIIRDIS